MKKQEKIEYIREKCIAANPSIKDLVFGCEFENGGDKFIFVEDDGVSYQVIFSGDDRSVGGFAKENVIKIIGRPITLADVLKSFQNKRKCPIGVSLNGDFMDCDDDCIKYEVLDVRWNLALPLSGQSEETLDSLISFYTPNHA